MNIIDIGASIGKFSDYVARDPENRVIAVEPLPDIASQIPHRENLTVFVSAIRDVDAPQKEIFTRSNYSEPSSFLAPNPNIDKDLWQHHLQAAIPIQQVEVEVLSLKQLLIKSRMEYVHFLKIDAQGLDLEVLHSSRDSIEAIQSAVLEFPYDDESALYKNEPSLIEGLSRANEMGFLPARIVPNGGGECNVFLYNKKHGLSNYLNIENQLKLFDAPTLKLNYRYGKKIPPLLSHRIALQLDKLCRKIFSAKK